MEAERDRRAAASCHVDVPRRQAAPIASASQSSNDAKSQRPSSTTGSAVIPLPRSPSVPGPGHGFAPPC
eukprot:1218236-Pyramimonas_sp.AAC.2